MNNSINFIYGNKVTQQEDLDNDYAPASLSYFFYNPSYRVGLPLSFTDIVDISYAESPDNNVLISEEIIDFEN